MGVVSVCVGAFGNCAFLLGICAEILLEAINRLLSIFHGHDDIEEMVGKADVILTVGVIGLCMNLIGLFIFGHHHHHHGHGHHHHGHGHHHGHKEEKHHHDHEECGSGVAGRRKSSNGYLHVEEGLEVEVDLHGASPASSPGDSSHGSSGHDDDDSPRRPRKESYPKRFVGKDDLSNVLLTGGRSDECKHGDHHHGHDHHGHGHHHDHGHDHGHGHGWSGLNLNMQGEGGSGGRKLGPGGTQG